LKTQLGYVDQQVATKNQNNDYDTNTTQLASADRHVAAEREEYEKVI